MLGVVDIHLIPSKVIIGRGEEDVCLYGVKLKETLPLVGSYLMLGCSVIMVLEWLDCF